MPEKKDVRRPDPTIPHLEPLSDKPGWQFWVVATFGGILLAYIVTVLIGT